MVARNDRWHVPAPPLRNLNASSACVQAYVTRGSEPIQRDCVSCTAPRSSIDSDDAERPNMLQDTSFELRELCRGVRRRQRQVALRRPGNGLLALVRQREADELARERRDRPPQVDQQVPVERIATRDDALAGGRNRFGALVCGDRERTHFRRRAHRGREADRRTIGGYLVDQLGG